MKNRYLEIREGSLIYIGPHGAKPRGAMVYLWPQALHGEDPRWLEVTTVDGQVVVVVNDTTKTSVQAQDAIDAANEAVVLAHQDKVTKYTKRFTNIDMIKSEILVVNESKGWTIGDELSYANNNAIQDIFRLLNQGNLRQAHDEWDGANLSLYYTAEEKTYIKNLMADVLNNE